MVGDDEWDCTYEPEDYGCPIGWLRPGTWQLVVSPATGGTYDGDCAAPTLGEYALRVSGEETMELVHDNVALSEL